MNSDEFTHLFEDLCNSFPNARIGESVGSTWYKRLSKFGFTRIKYAFTSLAASETRFPTLSQVVACCKEAVIDHTCYVIPKEPDRCLAKDLENDPALKCGCLLCAPAVYKRYADRYKRTYGRYPGGGREPVGWEVRANELAGQGEEGFRKLLREMKVSPRKGFESVSGIASRIGGLK